MRRLLSVLGVGFALSLAAPATSVADPVLEINGHHGPSSFQAGSVGVLGFYVNNVGDAPAFGPVTLTIDLPPGMTTRTTDVPYFVSGVPAFGWSVWECPSEADASSITCTFNPDGDPSTNDPVGAGGGATRRLSVYVKVAPGTTGPLEVQATGRALTVDGTEIAHTEIQQVPVGPPPAAFGLDPLTVYADALGRDTRPVRQAGAHPFRAVAAFDLNLRNSLELRSDIDGELEVPVPFGTPRNVDSILPRGFVGNPRAVGECPPARLPPAYGMSVSDCPADSQIGTIELSTQNLSGPAVEPTALHLPLYNMAPRDGVLADFGFAAEGRPVHIVAVLDPRDHSIVGRARNINEGVALHYQRITLWGAPADPIHDPDRWNPKTNSFGASVSVPGRAPRPFLTLPSQCGVDDTTDFTMASWQDPATWTPLLSSAPARLQGCEQLAFTPSITLMPDATQPDSPTGLKVDIEMPQPELADRLGTPPLRDATITLPEGMTINPSAAGGLDACGDDQLRLGTDLGLKAGEPSCPEASKIGSVTAKSPALEEPIEGSIHIRTQNSEDPASGEMFRVALVLKNEVRGLLVKLPGSVQADPATGRLTASFKNNPQLPVSHISVRLKSGQRAPLATPPSCGEKSFGATLSSWGGQASELTDAFTIGCPAPRVLSPSFAAGSADPRAGVFSPFAVNIERPDGQAYLNGLSMDLAPGMLAKLKGLPVCGEAAAAAGSCAAPSRVGTATVGAGSGAPFYLKGGVYLTGPYKGAPYGLAVKVRAAAGPFDLGDVIVRQALHVDRNDAHVTVISDPLPTIVKGVPVRLRSIDVNIDRPGFTSTPTSCAAKEVASTFSSPDGQTVSLRSPYRVGECAALDLEPSLALSLSGKGQTTDGKHPAVTANLIQQPGQANLKKVRVALPLSLALDPDNANGLCEFVDGSKAEPTCPKASIVGTATAVTPILDQPLTGPVYFVKNIRKDAKTGREIRTLPKLVIPLTGQNGLRLNLTGTSAVEDDQLVTTFDNIPDAPVSSFKLNINGGKGGILTVSDADICKSTQIADQQIDGQNNKNADASISIQTPSCPLKVLSKKVGKTSVALKVGGLGAGKVTVIGKGIKKTTKTISKSTVATITAKRTKGKPGKVTVSYDPTGPAKARKTSK